MQREWLLRSMQIRQVLIFMFADYGCRTKAQLVDALVAEWDDYLCHDDYDPEDLTSEEYRKEMEKLTFEQYASVHDQLMESYTP